MNALSMAKKMTAQKLAALWNVVAEGDRALAVDFHPLTAPVPLQVQRSKQAATAKARIIRVDCYLG